MQCPFCQSLNVIVVDSRPRDEQTTIWRRRKCLSCNRRFSSKEKIDFSYLVVVKKSGQKEIFSRDKIYMSMVKSFGKQPIPQEKLEKAVEEIIQEIHKLAKTTITTTEIGNLVLEKLRQLDLVDYIRYASVFKDFSNIETFKKEIEKVEGGDKNA